MGKDFQQIAFNFFAEEEPVSPKEKSQPTSKKEKLVESVVEEAVPVLNEEPIDISIEMKQEPKVGIKSIRKKVVGSTRGRRSLKEEGLPPHMITVPDDETLFQKQYYSISEVSGWFGEKQSLIRYWETEFDILQPKKNRKGDRLFRPVDIKNLEVIYDLLRRRKFTMEGAKEFLKKNKKAEERYEMIRSLEKIKSFFIELKASL